MIYLQFLKLFADARDPVEKLIFYFLFEGFTISQIQKILELKKEDIKDAKEKFRQACRGI